MDASNGNSEPGTEEHQDPDVVGKGSDSDDSEEEDILDVARSLFAEVLNCAEDDPAADFLDLALAASQLAIAERLNDLCRILMMDKVKVSIDPSASAVEVTRTT